MDAVVCKALLILNLTKEKLSLSLDFDKKVTLYNAVPIQLYHYYLTHVVSDPLILNIQSKKGNGGDLSILDQTCLSTNFI